MTDTCKQNAISAALTYDDVRAVSPALEHYTNSVLLDGLWKRPELSPRDRSVVTMAALIARIQTIEMPFHFALALDNGVKLSEPSEIITHLAFLFRMGERHVGCRDREGYLPSMWYWDRSITACEGKSCSL